MAFCIFVIVGILNLNFGKSLVTFAEESVSSEITIEVSPIELSEDANIIIIDDQIQESDDIEDIESDNQAITNLVTSGDVITTNEIAEITDVSDNVVTGISTTTIMTGDAIATVDVINQVNTNIVNSEGDILVGSGSLQGNSLDLRNGISASSEISDDCNSCISNISVKDENNATITNNVYVVASTGNNTNFSSSDSVIITGDAIAAANIVNVVNTNIIDSNYLLFVFNNLGEWSGDLVLPNGDFFESFFKNFDKKCESCDFNNIDVKNSNQASVINSLETESNTGNNDIFGDTNVHAGRATSVSNILNQINENVYNNPSFFLIIRIVGNWAGKIFNLPENIGWQKSDNNIVLYDKSYRDSFITNSNEFIGGGVLSLENNNTGFIENNIKLEANTGKNDLVGDVSSLITGNAFTGLNLVNIVNTNIISSNWIRAIINIFGDWNGNVSFGQPDLWMGTVLDTKDELIPGSVAKFKTTIKNNGDALATKILLNIFSDSENLKFSGELEKIIEIGSLMPGETREIEYDGNISPFHGFGSSNINIYLNLELFETDADKNNNRDNLSVSVVNYNRPTIFLPYNFRESSYPDLEVIKSHTFQDRVVINEKEGTPIGSLVDYKIIIKNKGGSAFEGILVDQLKNSTGEIINQQIWELNQIFPNEIIEITYTTEFSSSTVPGTYTNYAWVEALGGDYTYDKNLAEKILSNIASDSILVFSKPIVSEIVEQNNAVGEILGDFDYGEGVGTTEKNYYIDGMCFDEQQEKRKLSIKETLLYSLSFILIIRKRKDMSINLFMF